MNAVGAGCLLGLDRSLSLASLSLASRGDGRRLPPGPQGGRFTAGAERAAGNAIADPIRLRPWARPSRYCLVASRRRRPQSPGGAWGRPPSPAATRRTQLPTPRRRPALLLPAPP